MAEQESQDNLHLQSPVARQMLLGDVTPGWNIVQPMWVTIERDEDGSYLATDDIFLVYGAGESEREALQDYVTSLIDYYRLLEERLLSNPRNQPLFRHLQLYLLPAYATQNS